MQAVLAVVVVALSLVGCTHESADAPMERARDSAHEAVEAARDAAAHTTETVRNAATELHTKARALREESHNPPATPSPHRAADTD